MLDAEGRLGTGEYKGQLEEPDLCNPFATSLYEFHLLRHHYHPYVRDMTRHVASLTFNETALLPTALPNETMTMGPVELFKRFGKPLFDPPLTIPSKTIISGRQKGSKAPEELCTNGAVQFIYKPELSEPNFGLLWSQAK